MKKHQMDITEFSEKCGIKEERVERLLGGRGKPSHLERMCIAEAFGMTEEELQDIEPLSQTEVREVQTDEFLTSHDLLRFEEMRQELRELIKFLVDGVEGQKPVYTALADPVLEQTEGKALDSGYDFGEYRERVNRYIMEHRSDTLAIHKLTQNIPLSRGDYTELEHIFTCELGSKEDYAREFRDTPFGLLVRKVAKLDHDAAMQAFSKFINDESLNAKQIAFVQKVIHYIEQNGYVESKAVLMKPPFDQPILFTRLFDGKTGSELMDTINSVKENATHVTA